MRRRLSKACKPRGKVVDSKTRRVYAEAGISQTPPMPTVQGESKWLFFRGGNPPKGTLPKSTPLRPI